MSGRDPGDRNLETQSFLKFDLPFVLVLHKAISLSGSETSIPDTLRARISKSRSLLNSLSESKLTFRLSFKVRFKRFKV